MVGEPVNGQREYVFDIAAQTLGDGRRYPEILQLNVGRRQRNGGQLVDPAVLEPGWILVLPADASGPRVLLGSRSTLFPSSWPADPPPTQADAAQGGLINDGLVRGIPLATVLALLGFALWLLRRATLVTLPAGAVAALGSRLGLRPSTRTWSGVSAPSPSDAIDHEPVQI